MRRELLAGRSPLPRELVQSEKISDPPGIEAELGFRLPAPRFDPVHGASQKVARWLVISKADKSISFRISVQDRAEQRHVQYPKQIMQAEFFEG